MVGEKKYTPYLLITPWVLGFIIFKVYPFIHSFYLSLHVRINREYVFSGVQNYLILFDTTTQVGADFMNSMRVTFVYVFVTVPLILLVSLLVAYVLNKKIKGIGFFRTAYYVPTVLGTNVAIVLLWRELFESYGLINQFLQLIGLNPVNFFGSASGAMASIVLLRVWQFGSTMLIFLAALKNVPESLYEAATIDGAGKFRQFLSVTIPMITPIILFNGVMRLVETFQVFNGPMLITGGGPLKSTNVINMLIYETAFTNRNLNLGAAMSWVLFVIIMLFTIAIFRSQKYWVHYQD